MISQKNLLSYGNSPLKTKTISVSTYCNDELFVKTDCTGRVIGVYNEETNQFRIVKTDKDRKLLLYNNEEIVFDSNLSERWGSVNLTSN